MLQSLPSNYEQFPTMPKINIHPSCVNTLLDDLDTNKATGPDLIPTRVLKECSSILAPVLLQSISTCTCRTFTELNSQPVPDDWLTANVVVGLPANAKHRRSAGSKTRGARSKLVDMGPHQLTYYSMGFSPHLSVISWAGLTF